MKSFPHFFRYQLPFILWALLIFYLSSLSNIKYPIHFLNIDKVAHCGVFFTLGFLAARAFLFQNMSIGLQKKALFFTLLFVMLYGASDEFHQYFVPGRSSDVYDFLTDSFGGVLAIIAVKYLPKKLLL